MDVLRHVTQDTAINRLVSDHAPSFTHLISDPRISEWSQCLHAAMVHYFEQKSLDDASVILAPAIQSCINAHRADLFEDACAAAAEESPRHYYSLFESMQQEAIREADDDFLHFKTELEAEFQAKCDDAKEEVHSDLSAFKHALIVEFNERKDADRLEAAKGGERRRLPVPRSRCKGRRTDPIGERPSRSISRTGPPSASSRASTPSHSPAWTGL